MKIKYAIGALLCCLSLAAFAADTVKKTLPGCTSEELLDEFIGYMVKGDKESAAQLFLGGQCTMLRAGEPISIIKPGFTVATVRYKGVKLFTPSEAVR